MSPDGKLPRGLLLEGKPAIKNALKQFNLAKELDKNNEKRPKKKWGEWGVAARQGPEDYKIDL